MLLCTIPASVVSYIPQIPLRASFTVSREQCAILGAGHAWRHGVGRTFRNPVHREGTQTFGVRKSILYPCGNSHKQQIVIIISLLVCCMWVCINKILISSVSEISSLNPASRSGPRGALRGPASWSRQPPGGRLPWASFPGLSNLSTVITARMCGWSDDSAQVSPGQACLTWSSAGASCRKCGLRANI